MEGPGADAQADRLARRCAAIFLSLGVPVLLLLSFVTGPFGVGDEAAHFLRAVSLAQGGVVPVVSIHDPGANPSGRSAGGRVDAAAAGWALPYLDGGLEQHGNKFSAATVHRDMARRPAHRDVYVRHSNTAIYPPILYVTTAAAISVARAVDLPVPAWLYAARVASVVAGAALIWWALRRARGGAPFLLVCATFPLTLFEIASVSADALLLPTVILFAALTARIATGAREERGDTPVLGIASVVIGVGKVAYMPLVLLPPVVAWLVDRRLTPRVIRLGIAAAVAIVLWAGWAVVVRGKVFSFVPQFEVDPQAQLAFVLHAPARFAALLLRTAIVRLPELAFQTTGRLLGWNDFKTPYVVVAATLAMAGLTALFADRPERQRRGVPMLALALCLICYLAAFVFLYLQFNQVSSGGINGAQGRYLLPLGIVLLGLTPRRTSPAFLAGRWPVLLGGWCAAVACVTLAIVARRYWA